MQIFPVSFVSVSAGRFAKTTRFTNKIAAAETDVDKTL